MLYPRIFALIVILLTQVSPTWAQTSDSSKLEQIRYVIGTSKLANHTLQVQATYPSRYLKGDELTLALPVWTPGSYKVRDYSRFIDQLKLSPSHSQVTISKISKNRWKLSGLEPNRPVTVSYEVYGRELTVRTNYFTEELGLLIGAATFVSPPQFTDPNQRDPRFEEAPFTVSFADRQIKVSTALPLTNDQTGYLANNYDQLLDSPFLFGDIDIHAFTAGRLPHYLVQAGDRRFWDTQQSLKDLKKIVEVQQKFWGSTPYSNYTFMNLVTDTRGGLEHENSTVMMTSRFATENRKKYVAWLSLVSHEFFHTWNVKRLRPKALGPFDYEKEVYTESLWIAEGITSYYDNLLVRRAGLSTRDEYLEALSKGLNTLASTPGRKNIPLTQASQDAWVRLYQDSEHNVNSNISYYNKGAVVAWLLDTEIRRTTRGQKSLDDVMRKAYSKFSQDGFQELEFRALASEVAGKDVTPFFLKALDSTQDLDLEPALAYWNLEWKLKDKESSPYLGAQTKTEGSKVIVKAVLADSPAARAGVAPGDELISLHKLRIPAEGPKSILKHLEIGTEYELLVARLGVVKSLTVRLSEPLHSTRKLKQKPDHDKRLWNQWLGPETKDKS